MPISYEVFGGVIVTFNEFLAGRKAVFDATGDFVRVAKIDPEFPSVDSLEEVQAYLSTKYGQTVIWHAAEVVWKEYQAAERKLLKSDWQRLR